MSQPHRLYLACRNRGGHAVVTAIGSITADTVIQLRTSLLQMLARRQRNLVLDLSGVDHIDDTGLDALRRTAARAQLVGGQLRLVAPSPRIAERLRNSSLRRHLTGSTTLAGVLGSTATEASAAPDDPTAVPLPADVEESLTGT